MREKEKEGERERPISKVADEDRVMAVVEDSARVEPLLTEVPATLVKVTLLPAVRVMGVGGASRQASPSCSLRQGESKQRKGGERRERKKEDPVRWLLWRRR